MRVRADGRRTPWRSRIAATDAVAEARAKIKSAKADARQEQTCLLTLKTRSYGRLTFVRWALGLGLGADGRANGPASIDSWMFWTSSVAWTAGRSNVAWTAAAEDAFGRWDWGCARTVGRVDWMPVFRLYKSSTSPWRTVGRWDWVSAQSVGRVASCSAWDAGRRASRL